MLRKKYQQEEPDLIEELLNKGRTTEVHLLDNGTEKTIPVIAIDVTQALAKLEPHLDIGIPSTTLKWMLGTERNVTATNVNL